MSHKRQVLQLWKDWAKGRCEVRAIEVDEEFV